MEFFLVLSFYFNYRRSVATTGYVSLDILKPVLGETQAADLASLMPSKKQALPSRLRLLTPSIASSPPSPLLSPESATDATGTTSRPTSSLTTKRPSSTASRSSPSKRGKDPNKTIYNELKYRWELFNMVDSIPNEPSNLEYQELNYLASLMYQVAEDSLQKLTEKRMDG